MYILSVWTVAIPLAILLLAGCSKGASIPPAPLGVDNAGAQSASRCLKDPEEGLTPGPVQASLLRSQEEWYGPEAPIKTIWRLAPDIWHLQDAVVISGHRLDGPERAEFKKYDGAWVRRKNLVFYPPHLANGLTDGKESLSLRGYVIYPAPGCWQFEARAGAKVLATLTTLVTYEGPEVQRLLPPAASEHGEPPPEIPQSLLQTTCPGRDNGIRVTSSKWGYSLHIALSLSSDSQVDPVSVEWLSPDKSFGVRTTGEPPVRLTARNLTSGTPAWFDYGRDSFSHYQKELTFTGEPQQGDGEDKVWYGSILFPEPGCWLITAKSAEIERELSIWLEPVSRRTS